MAENTQKFLEAEESAERVLQALEALHEEATNYRDSANELTAVRAELVGLIEATQKVSEGTHEAVQSLRACVESGAGDVFSFRILPEFDFSLGCNPSPAIPAV